MVFRFDNKMVLALWLAVVSALVLAPAAGAWSWPVDGPVLRGFAADDDPYLGGQHRGIDIGARGGAEVRAPASGVVGFAGSVPRAGLTVTIRTEDGYSITLVQLGSIGVRVGTHLTEGDVLGTVGPTGEAEHRVPYVHLGIRLTAEPHGYLDPLQLLPRRETPGAPAVPPAEPPPPATVVAPVPGASMVSPTEPPPVGVTSLEPSAPSPARSQRVTAAGPAGGRTHLRPVEAGEAYAPVRRAAPASPIRRPTSLKRRVRAGASWSSLGRPALPLELGETVATTAAATVAPARARSPRRAARASSAARRTSRWLVVPALLGLASCGAGLLSRRRRTAVAVTLDSEGVRKMSQIRLRLEARLAELDFATDSRRRRLAVRQRPAAHRPCRRVRRSVRCLRALSPPARKPRADGQRHGRARDARDGHRRPRRELATRDR